MRTENNFLEPSKKNDYRAITKISPLPFLDSSK